MRNLLFIGLTIFSMLVYGQSITSSTTTEYICPPCGSHCDSAVHTQPGACSHCNMVLVRKDLSKTIAFYLQDGVEVLDFAGPMEVFSYAGYKVFTVSRDKQPITSQGILSIVPDYSIEDAPKADIVAFFGGNASAAYEDRKVIKWLQAQDQAQYHFSVCTGAFVLAEAGILDGLAATTFHNALDGLTDNYPAVDVKREVRFVDNGKVITTAGISAGIDGALHLVAKLQGLNAAKRTAYYMEYDNWVPGDGLVLAGDNPYQEEETDYSDYLGRYPRKEGGEFELLVRNGELTARFEDNYYPIYRERGDIFSDVSSEPIYFERDQAQQVVGYRFRPEGALFEKLD